MIFKKIDQGDLLIALPCITGSDLTFSRSVVLLTEHDNDATVGYILNKPTSTLLNQLIPETEGHFTIYDGGPVEQDNLYCLHNRADLISESIYIKNNLYTGGNFEEIFYLINSKQLTNRDIRFFRGYAGWKTNQLQGEINDKYWKLVKDKETNLFDSSSSTLWKDLVTKLGKKYEVITNAPLDPTFN